MMMLKNILPHDDAEIQFKGNVFSHLHTHTHVQPIFKRCRKFDYIKLEMQVCLTIEYRTTLNSHLCQKCRHIMHATFHCKDLLHFSNANNF